MVLKSKFNLVRRGGMVLKSRFNLVRRSGMVLKSRFNLVRRVGKREIVFSEEAKLHLLESM